MNIEQIKAQAKAEAMAEVRAELESEYKAKAERTQAVFALDTSDEIKTLLTGDGFASVPMDDITALVKAMPQSFEKIMDDDGGAGVEPNPTDFADKSNAKVEAEKRAEAEAKLAELNQKGVL